MVSPYSVGMPLLTLIASLRAKMAPNKGQRDPFLIYEPEFLCNRYKDENALNGWLPYREEACWVKGSILETTAAGKSLKVETTFDKFQIDGSNSVLRTFQEQLAEAKRADGGFSRDENVIRLSAFSKEGEQSLFKVQPAKYGDQVRSNLGMDWEGPHELMSQFGIPTFRSLLLSQYGSRLPPLSDTRLGNTVGTSVVILYRGDGGELVPYLPRRRKKSKGKQGVGVFTLGQFQSSASGAAKWEGGFAFDEVFAVDLYRELDEEVGLKDTDISFMTPVAYCREFLRGGKPQIMYVGFTELGITELRARRKSRLESASRDGTSPIEIEDEELPVRSFAELATRISPDQISTEALANLYYAAQVAEICKVNLIDQ